MIDQSLVILGKDAQFSGCFQAKAKTCDVTFLLEAHGAQQFSQKFQTPPRIILIELLAETSDIETCVNEFSCGRSRRININDVAIPGITQMMVNINPDFRRPNCWKSCAKAILNCRVERDGNVEILGSGRRLGKQLGPGKEGILLQDSIFIPDTDFFSECLKRKRQRKLAA